MQISGTDRRQMQYISLEELVAQDSIVRIIDAFVDTQDLKALGFDRTEAAETGRPGYAADPLVKLYVYGYYSSLRSSRKLHKETTCNIEVKWLLNELSPDYKTISEFRRINIRPLQKLLREFERLCQSWGLIGGELFALDGTKIKASNNKKQNYSKKKLRERLTRIEKKIEEYLLSSEEDEGQDEKGSEALKGLKEMLERKEQYEAYLSHLETSGENEISIVDPDARLMGNNRGGVEVSYNVQCVVDGKHDIIVDYDVTTNPSDQGYLSIMVKRLKRKGYRRFTLTADKGYFNGECLQKAKRYKVKAIVARQDPSNPKGQPEEFHSEKFQYQDEIDAYLCPKGELLPRRSGKTIERRRYFDKKACARCEHVSICAPGKKGYRTVSRGEYASIYEEADLNYKENREIYRRRQEMVEHPFGTIKHTMNGGYFLLRTRRKVRAEVALLMLGYNLRRAVSVLGFGEIMARLNNLTGSFSCFSSFKKLFTSLFDSIMPVNDVYHSKLYLVEVVP